MIDLISFFDIHQQKQIGGLRAQQASTSTRITKSAERLTELEQRYERMRLICAALWQLLKAHTGLTDGDLKHYIEKIDLADGQADGKMNRATGAMDCQRCSRRILKSATVCAWCGAKIRIGDPFHAT